MVSFPATEHHCLSAGTKLFCLVTEAHVCEQLAQSCYMKVELLKVEPATLDHEVQCSNQYTSTPHIHYLITLLGFRNTQKSKHCLRSLLLGLHCSYVTCS